MQTIAPSIRCPGRLSALSVRVLFAALVLIAMQSWLIGNRVWAEAKRPNIVFIMTDDQAPWAFGPWRDHKLGQSHAVTPNMDKLARQGAYLPNMFTPTPVCSPSRASLATSRYGSELGITDWIHPRSEPKLGLDPKTFTWYEALQAAGYHTGLVGKWHLGLTDAHHPTKTGFDYFMGHRGGGWPNNNPTLEVNGQNTKLKGLNVDILTDNAIAFLKDRPKDKPFLLVLHYRAPHTRWLPVAPADWKPYDKLDPKLPHPNYPGLDVARAKRMMREYLASVSGVDRNLGRLFKTMDELKLTDNTMTLFTSDHGYNMGHNGIWHKGNGHWVLKKDKQPAATANIPRGQRPNMYDHSIRVPTAVRWPGVVKPGTVMSRTVTFLDIYPTLVAIADAQVPKGEVIRGRNFSQLLRGEKLTDWSDDYYGEYSTKHQSRTHMRCYRTPKWKLVLDLLNPERNEIFDLTDDPGETTNMFNVKSAQALAMADELTRKIHQKMREHNDPQLPLMERRLKAAVNAEVDPFAPRPIAPDLKQRR